MIAFIIRRLFWMVPILLGVSVITFAMLKNVPGDPVSRQLGGGAGRQRRHRRPTGSASPSSTG